MKITTQAEQYLLPTPDTGRTAAVDPDWVDDICRGPRIHAGLNNTVAGTEGDR